MTVFKWRYIQGASHTRAKLFVGPDKDHLAFAGELCMRSEEWPGFLQGLKILSDMSSDVPGQIDQWEGSWMAPIADTEELD